MRRMFRRSNSGSIDSTPESRYARIKTAGWLMRLFDKRIVLSSELFACTAWCLGGLDFCLQGLIKEAASYTPVSKNEDEMATLEELKRVSLYNLGNALEDFLQEHPRHHKSARALLQAECREMHSTRMKRPRSYAMAAKRLEELFGLDRESVDLCEFLFINRSFEPVESYFEDNLQAMRFGGIDFLAHMLGITASRCRNILRELAYLGIAEVDRRFVALEDSIRDLWTESDSTRVSQSFCRPLEGEALPLENFSIPAEQVEHVRALLRQPSDRPMHILLYGAPGTGKTTFARSLAAAEGIPAWSVSPPQGADNDRRAQLTAGVRIASQNDKAFLLVDEAERILDCDMFSREKNVDKAWLNTFLEKPGQRVLWITNHVHHLEGAVRRRFHFSIHFEPLGSRERSAMWRQILERRGVLNRVNDAELTELSRTYDVPASVMEMSVTQAAALTGRKRSAFVPALRRVVDSYETLLRDGGKQRKKIAVAPHYDPKGVSLEGSVDTLVNKLSRVDRMLRSGGELNAGAATMLFYGPPGTGKTALARYLADRLDRECKVVRASDLLGPYVGMTEANIAEAFRDAERDDAVLVIDEADSFLFPREKAAHSWETTQVNEFLTALEECRGFCICTSNRRENMDQAAMRRFSHKIAFTYSKPEQVQALYDALLAPLTSEPMSKELETELLAMRRLTPGDFHAVRSRMLFDGGKGVEHHVLLEGLRNEQELKLDIDRRGMGFLK
ncbi:MAG: AAA family ATPase [Desulfomicrobium sp.]|nr:AAA family ATPase [Desulfomicrobium sp.]MBV1719905.1 AAA family ATPase [Desulfomicrobium sp.]MBV1748796.1 AAA family ATPase [Desulfomicrobium sp.]